MLKLRGNLPTELSYALAAADSRYFRSYAPALVASAHAVRQPLHIHVTNPDRESFRLIKKIEELPNFSVTYDQEVLDGFLFNDKHKRVYYSCLRTLVAEALQAEQRATQFVIDIDSLFNRMYVHHPSVSSIGLYLRNAHDAGARTPTELRGMRCLGCYIVPTAQSHFPGLVAKMMRDEDFGYWFVDQVALIETTERHDIPVHDIKHMKILDWTFRDDKSILWTGKGDRKVSDPVYVAKFDEWTKHARSLFGDTHEHRS